MQSESFESSLLDYKTLNEGQVISFDRLFLQEQYVTGLGLKIQDNNRKKKN